MLSIKKTQQIAAADKNFLIRLFQTANHSALPPAFFPLTAGVQPRFRRSIQLVALAFISAPVDALYQEYQLAGSIAAAPGYSFATAQYRLYANEALMRKDSLAFEYDLDSLYGDYAYGVSQYFRLGAAAKAHVFDYQNLNHIVDSTTGAETKSVSLNAPFYKGQFYAEARYKALGLRYSAGAQKYELSKRETTNAALTVASPGAAFVHTAALGYWQLQAPKSYVYTGVAAYLSAEAQQLSSPYVWQISGTPLSVSRESFTVHELQVRAGEQFGGGGFALMGALRAGATSFALPGETQDVIQSFSVGGPESRYRRLAGYSFSEFRVPAYALVNFDAIVRIAGPVNFWAIADAAVFDRDYNARRLHAGAGAGFIVDLPDNTLGSRSAVFARAEMPFFAAGVNRFQIFIGINGQVF